MKVLPFVFLLLSSLNVAGKAYFQQRVDTKIDVRLDDSTDFIHGFEQIHYVNQSPDTLHFIYLHLWPNAFSSDKTFFGRQQLQNENTDFYFSKPEERGYIDSLSFQVSGRNVSIQLTKDHPDIARIDLPKPLLPGAEISLSTPFRVKVPLVFSRLGHIGQAYYISQWFPKPAVYDKDGWHPMSFADQGEFYSEFGTYDVNITLPKNYIVLATGNCLDASENVWMDSLASRPFDTLEPAPGHYRSWMDSINAFPVSSKDWKTLHFHEENIHDFAWFADKRLWLKMDTVTVPAGEGVPAHPVKIYVGYIPSDEAYWRKATDYIKTTIRTLSAEIGPYPYNTVKAVEGELRAGGGMEYPTVTLLDQMASRNAVMTTLVHEVGHNWFYGILGSNERDHPWMDEGMNTFYERRISRDIRTPMDFDDTYTTRLEDLLYFNAAATRTDEALNSTSDDYMRANYGADVYYKAARMLRWLEGWMGRDSFRSGMRAYYQQWKFRHPGPEDFEAAMKAHSSKDLDWFFDGAMKTRRGVDFAIKKPQKSQRSDHLLLRNASDFAAPIHVEGFQNGNLVDSLWVPPFHGDTLVSVATTKDILWKPARELPDYYGFNDDYKAGTLFCGKKPQVRFGFRFRRDETADLFYLPGIGYNVYDGFMAGLVLHNLGVPQQRFRFGLAPMYAFGSHSFAGAATLAYWIFPKSTFQEIVPQLDIKSFHYDSSTLNVSSRLNARFIKLAPSITFEFPRKHNRFLDAQALTIKGYGIWEERITQSVAPGDSMPKARKEGWNFLPYALLRFQQRGRQGVNYYSFQGDAQFGSGFAKLGAEAKYQLPFDIVGRSVYFRGYLGKYIQTSSKGADPRYWLNSSFSGSNDYLYDGTYIARNGDHGFFSRQVSMQDGAGRMPANRYDEFTDNRSDDWLAAINVKTDIPYLPLPLRLYADVSYNGAQQLTPGQSRFLYSAGLEIHALNDIVLIHIPFFLESGYKNYLSQKDPGNVFWQSISFSLQLQNVSWLRSVTTGTKYYLW
jgi:hypothetical protein